MVEFKQRKERYFNRFGIECDLSEVDAKKHLRNSISNFLENIDFALEEAEVKKYCGWFGFKTEFVRGYGGSYGKNVENCIIDEFDWQKYLFKIEQLFYLNFNDTRFKNSLFMQLKSVFSNSILQIEFIFSKNHFVVYPSGASFLDEVLVEKTLNFLPDKTHQHFVDALKFYQQNIYIKSCESIRRSLEEYLRHLLDNSQGLKENISTIGRKLKEDHSPSEVRNQISQFLILMDKFFNENSKHHDGPIDDAECEFAIFCAATIMRYLFQKRKVGEL